MLLAHAGARTCTSNAAMHAAASAAHSLRSGARAHLNTPIASYFGQTL